MDLLTYERDRSERHNQFFAVFGLWTNGSYDREVLWKVRAHLRSSDYVLPLPLRRKTAASQMHRIGVILPHTDPQGAARVKKRLIAVCAGRTGDFQIGMALYPDDATTPDHLLAVAFNPGLPFEGHQLLSCGD